MRATRWSRTAYQCPACGDWHDESETSIEEVYGFRCFAEGECEEFHEGEPLEPVRGIETGGRAVIPESDIDGLLADYYPCPDDPDNVFGGDPIPAVMYRMECGELVDDLPEPGDAWQCGECEEVYGGYDEARDEARECCRD